MSAAATAAIGLLLVLGAGLILVGAIGLIRMPDVYNRMQAASKAPVLGALLLLVALALVLGGLGVWMRALSTVVLLVLTTPVASHLIARAAWVGGVEPEPGTVSERRHPEATADDQR